jgi:hypothetical protein
MVRELAERHVDSSRQMTGRPYEFLRLSHINNDKGHAGRKPLLKFRRLNPSRFLCTEPAEQSRYESDHGKRPETNSP